MFIGIVTFYTSFGSKVVSPTSASMGRVGPVFQTVLDRVQDLTCSGLWSLFIVTEQIRGFQVLRNLKLSSQVELEGCFSISMASRTVY